MKEQIKLDIKKAMGSVGDLDTGLGVRQAAVDAIYEAVSKYLAKDTSKLVDALQKSETYFAVLLRKANGKNSYIVRLIREIKAALQEVK